MRYINLENWPRSKHFKLFNKWDFPHFSLCANVDITRFYLFIKQHEISFTISIIYLITRAANSITEFRYRIRKPEVVIEHEVINPSMTILIDEDLFSFCSIKYVQNFSEFAALADKRIAEVKNQPWLENKVEGDDLIYMTAIPWVSFTGFMHAIHLNPVDSIPRFAWGKFFKNGDSTLMPLSVQGHHALMDGIHMGKFYTKVQEYLDNPLTALK